MKIIHIILLLFPLLLFGQSYDKVHIDTVKCCYLVSPNGDSTIGTVSILSEGFNQFVDTNGVLLCEGILIRNSKFRFLYGRYNSNLHLVKYGLWIYYKEGRISEIRTFDRSGVEIATIAFYDNGQIRTKQFRKSRKTYNWFSNSYEKDGRKISESISETQKILNMK